MLDSKIEEDYLVQVFPFECYISTLHVMNHCVEALFTEFLLIEIFPQIIRHRAKVCSLQKKTKKIH